MRKLLAAAAVMLSLVGYAEAKPNVFMAALATVYIIDCDNSIAAKLPAKYKSAVQMDYILGTDNTDRTDFQRIFKEISKEASRPYLNNMTWCENKKSWMEQFVTSLKNSAEYQD